MSITMLKIPLALDLPDYDVDVTLNDAINRLKRKIDTLPWPRFTHGRRHLGSTLEKCRF